MYRGFNLDLDMDFQDYKNYGNLLYSSNSRNIQNSLNKYISIDGSLRASRMMNDWFPSIKTDVFISHSHEDKDIAINLSGWLWKKFKLKSFVDSCVWGHADSLIKIIDKKYCKIEGNTFEYTCRNFSTSHVHNMLCSALTMMIDKTECLFFLNTPNSITTKDTLESTYSPWLYYETTISQIIRKKKRSEHRVLNEQKMTKIGSYNKGFKIEYNLSLDHLIQIDKVNLDLWEKVFKTKIKQYPLDTLYNLNPIK